MQTKLLSKTKMQSINKKQRIAHTAKILSGQSTTQLKHNTLSKECQIKLKISSTIIKQALKSYLHAEQRHSDLVYSNSIQVVLRNLVAGICLDWPAFYLFQTIE